MKRRTFILSAVASGLVAGVGTRILTEDELADEGWMEISSTAHRQRAGYEYMSQGGKHYMRWNP